MLRGVEFEAGGKRRELRFDVNAMCRLEADFAGLPIDRVAERLQPATGMPTITDIRAAFRAGLVGGATLDEAGEIMSEVGIAEAGRLIGAAMQLAFPDAAQAEGAGGGKPTAAA